MMEAIKASPYHSFPAAVDQKASISLSPKINLLVEILSFCGISIIYYSCDADNYERGDANKTSYRDDNTTCYLKHCSPFLLL
jgi:hypothetical protein